MNKSVLSALLKSAEVSLEHERTNCIDTEVI